jgi:arylesterase/paraoxonase
MMLREAVKIAVLAIVVYKVVEKGLSLGVHLHYRKHHPGECRQVKGFDYACEDLEVTKDGIAFITSGVAFTSMSPGFAEFLKTNNIRGNIYLYDFKKPDLGARKLKIKPSKDFNPDTFHPHGISLLEDATKGEHLLYVISHPDNSDDAVEKFRYLPKRSELVHLKSFSSDKLHMANDLAVLAEDKFFISDCLYFKNQFLSILEQVLLPFGLGSLVFFDGSDYKVLDSWLHGPNGVSLSSDERHLYVSLPLISSMNVYEVKADSSLVQLQSVPLHTMADNFHLSQSGDTIYTGAHPVFYQTMSHILDPNQLSPSSVLSIPLKNGKVVPENITELFYDHGDLISGSSVAAVYDKKLLIGSIVNRLVICDVNL